MAQGHMTGLEEHIPNESQKPSMGMGQPGSFMGSQSWQGAPQGWLKQSVVGSLQRTIDASMHVEPMSHAVGNIGG